MFLSADYSGVKRMDLVAGMRLDFIRLEAKPGGSGPESTTSRQAVTGFLGTSYKITDNLVLFGNLSRAYRVPSLGELFYSGVTGRGMIIAKPDLNPETSMNIDGGLKFFGKRLFAGIYSFYYNIDNLIERYLVEPQLYTYGNVDRGRISGYELEIQCYPLSGWTIFGNYYSFSGKNKRTEAFLNDVPPPRLYMGTKIWLGHFSLEADGIFQSSKKFPGPAETAIPGFEIVNLRAGYVFNAHLKIYTVFSNIFNSLFYARPDPDSVYEPGRNFILGVTYSF
jgi:outer membrane receptor protein involved in Fe transport